MDSSVSGKTVIVTGAANGVGLAIARRFVELEANNRLSFVAFEAVVRIFTGVGFKRDLH